MQRHGAVLLCSDCAATVSEDKPENEDNASGRETGQGLRLRALPDVPLDGRAGCRLSGCHAGALPLKSSAENVQPLKMCRYAVTEHRWQAVCCALPSAVSRTVVLWPHAGLRAVTGALHAARTVRTACSAGFFERVSLRGLLYTGFRGQTAAAGKGGRFCPAYLHVSMCLFLSVGARQDASGSADCSSRNPHAPDVPRLRFVQQARSGNIRRSSKGRGRFSADRRGHCWAGTAI